MLEDVYNESAFESANSAIIENEKYLDSLSGHIAQLTTAWQELQTTMVDSSFLKGLTDMGTGALKGTTGLLNQLSPTSLLMTMMGGVAGLNGIGIQYDRKGKLKSIPFFKNFKDDAFVKNLQQQFEEKVQDIDDWLPTGFGEGEGLEIPAEITLKDLDLTKAGLDDVSDSMKELAEQAQNQGMSFSVFTDRIKQNTGAWSQLRQVAMGTLATMGASFAVSLGVDFIQKLTAAPQAIAESAAAIGNTIKNETASIDEYREKVESLYETINDPTASIEEQANARQELLSVQNELIANYGSEASLLSSVSVSAESAASAFDRLAESQYRINMNNFLEDSESGIIKRAANGLANMLDGYEDNVARMTDMMENQSIIEPVANSILSANQDLAKDLRKIYEQNGLEVTRSAAGDHFADQITGNAYQMQNAAKQIQELLNDYQYTLGEETFKNASDRMSELTNNIDKAIIKYGDLYTQQTYYEKILGDQSGVYKGYYDSLAKYAEEYKKAFASGDTEAINESISNFTSAYTSAMEKAGSDTGNGKAISAFFNNLYSGMRSSMGKYQFGKDFEDNIGGVKDAVKGYLDALKEMTSEDILEYTKTDNSEQAQSWENLKLLAEDYGMSLSDLVPILQDLGYVQSNAFRDLANRYADHIEEISNYTPEELQIAYRLSAEGMDFDDLDAQIQRERGLIEIGFDINDRSGLEEYNNITSNNKSKHADYDQYKQMMKDAQELYEAGRIGEEQFKKAAELFSENGMDDAANWVENYKALNKYFTDDSSGAQKLVKDMSNLKDSGGQAFAVFDEGTDTWRLNLDNMGELAEKLHVPMEMLQVLLENLQSYGFTNDYFGNMETGADHLTQLYKDLATEEAKYQEMVSNGTTGTAIDEQKQKIEDLKDSIEITRNGMNNLMLDAENASEESKKVYEAQKQGLEELINAYNNLDENDEAYYYQKQALKEAIESTREEFNIPVKFEGDTASIDDSLKLAKENIQDAVEEYRELTTGKNKLALDSSEVQQAKQDVADAIAEKQKLEEPAIMKVNTGDYDLNLDDGAAINRLQEFMRAWNELQSLNQQKEMGIHVDDSEISEAEAKADELAGQLADMDGEQVLVKMGIDTSSADKTQIAPQVKDVDMSTVNNTIDSIKNPTVKVDADTGSFDSKTSKVKSEVKAIDAMSATPSISITGNAITQVNAIKNALDSIKSKTVTVTTNKVENTLKGKADGTFHVAANAKGNVGAIKDELSVVGEEGMEGIVRDGQFFTVGENGAEMFRIKKGDLVFSAMQTQQLLKNGKITQGKRRAAAFATGNAGGGGSRGVKFNQVVEETTTTTKKTSTNGGSKKSSSGSGSSKKKTSSKKSSSKKKSTSTPEIFDWIELKIETLERQIKKLDTVATSAFTNWDKRGSKLTKEISKVTKELEVQQDAVNRYKTDKDVKRTFKNFSTSTKSSKTNKKNAKLNDSLAKYKKIIDNGGKVDISTIKNDKLAEKIKNYQTYITKSREASAAVVELTEKLKELNKQKFENLKTRYEETISVIEHESEMLDAKVSKLEEKGYIVAQSYYRDLSDYESKKMAELKKEQAELISQRDEAVSKGQLDEYSEEWYNQTDAINEVAKSIEECDLNLLKYAKDIRNVNKQLFELAQNNVSYVAGESDFLIDLLSNYDLFGKENGKITNAGLATLGSYALNYEVHGKQAEMYVKRLEELDRELAKEDNKYNTELLEERQDVIESYQEMISTREADKQSIKGLVQEGINAELDSLKKLIDKYTDLLDTEKDALDYQKKIKDSTKELSSLEKQYAALRNDDSEEGRAKRQKLQVQIEEAKENLEDTKFDRLISDQKETLSSLYDEYEEVLNRRLDNLDALMTDMINIVNANAGTIDDTIGKVFEQTGYKDQYLKNIWGQYSVGNIITAYTGDFSKLNQAVDGLKTPLSTIDSSVGSVGTAVGVVKSGIDSITTQYLDKIVKNTAALVDYVKVASSNNANNTNTANKDDSKNNQATSADKTVSGNLQLVQGGNKTSSGVSSTIERVNVVSGDLVIQNAKTIDTVDNSTIQRYDADGRMTSTHALSSTSRYRNLGFASGKKKVKDDQLAWTQEYGSEAIVRPSDGAVLTPLAKGDSVLNAQATKNLWNMTNDPSKFIRENMGGISAVPINNNNNSNYTQNFENITFNLPNVKNYEQLISQMQSDKNFEKLILAMSVDRLAGGSSLGKYKALR